MARWVAGVERSKTCADCEKLADQTSFARGTNVKIFEVFDCANCLVFKSQPNERNENVIELYYALPSNYDGWTGMKIISTSDIEYVFKLYNVDERLWDTYYRKLMFFHSELKRQREKVQETKSKAQRTIEKWKRSFTSRRGAK